MGKIVKFKTKTDNVLDFLDMVKDAVEQEGIDNMMIACKCKDGSVITGYTKNLNHIDKIYLKSHIESDITKEMIQRNFITPE